MVGHWTLSTVVVFLFPIGKWGITKAVHEGLSLVDESVPVKYNFFSVWKTEKELADEQATITTVV